MNLKREFKAKTEGQVEAIRAIAEHDLTFLLGPAGCGKTAISIALAMEALSRGDIDKIVVVRPTIGSDVEGIDEGIGYVKGTFEEKMYYYCKPIYEEILTYTDKAHLDKMIADETLDITPAYYCRGRNYHKSFVILDDAQNFSFKQLLALITRLGKTSKMVVNGDPKQCDRESYSALITWTEKIVNDINEIPVVELSKVDIIRHELLKLILMKVEAYEG